MELPLSEGADGFWDHLDVIVLPGLVRAVLSDLAQTICCWYSCCDVNYFLLLKHKCSTKTGLVLQSGMKAKIGGILAW